jgi:hypothetical protein
LNFINASFSAVIMICLSRNLCVVFSLLGISLP